MTGATPVMQPGRRSQTPTARKGYKNEKSSVAHRILEIAVDHRKRLGNHRDVEAYRSPRGGSGKKSSAREHSMMNGTGVYSATRLSATQPTFRLRTIWKRLRTILREIISTKSVSWTGMTRSASAKLGGRVR